MRILTLSVLIAAFAVAADCQTLSSIPASFVDIGFGARPAAMGGAFAAVANDVNAMMWNPAGLGTLQKDQATFAYTNQLGLLPYQYFGIAHPFASKTQALGLAVVSSGDKAMRELTVQATYARALTSQLSAGITMKYRRATFGSNAIDGGDYFVFDPEEISEGLGNQIQGSANGFGVDAGVTYAFMPNVSFGIVLKDAFAPMRWNSKTASGAVSAQGIYSESLPAALAIGSAVKMFDNFLVVLDYDPALSKTVNNRLKAGGEWTLLKIIALRAGIQQDMSNETKSAYSFGVGCEAPVVNGLSAVFDYTYMHQTIAATQRFSIGVEF
jgi:opacity protein-like surface antigen